MAGTRLQSCHQEGAMRVHALSVIIGAAAAAIALPGPALHSQEREAPPAASAPRLKGTLTRIKVHGKALEGNLMGESADPDVSVYLPASYNVDRARRYPVVYLLHGYTGTDLSFFGPTGRQLQVI